MCLGTNRQRARADPEWKNYMRWPPGHSWSHRPGTNTVMFDGDWKNVYMSELVCRISAGTVHWLKPGTPERARIEKVEDSENNKIRIGGVEGRLSRDTFQITFADGDVWERVREAASSGEESDAAVPTSPGDAALLPPAPSATSQDDRETPRWTPETGRTEKRRARDGHFYSRAEFIAFYGERDGQTRWAEAGAVAAEGLAIAGLVLDTDCSKPSEGLPVSPSG